MMIKQQKILTPDERAEAVLYAPHDGEAVGLRERIVDAIRAAVAQEREECAAVADHEEKQSLEIARQGFKCELSTAIAQEARMIAKKIRARGDAITQTGFGKDANIRIQLGRHYIALVNLPLQKTLVKVLEIDLEHEDGYGVVFPSARCEVEQFHGGYMWIRLDSFISEADPTPVVAQPTEDH